MGERAWSVKVAAGLGVGKVGTPGGALYSGGSVDALHAFEVGAFVGLAAETVKRLEQLAAVDAAAEQIKSGALVVHDYTSDNTCPAAQF